MSSDDINLFKQQLAQHGYHVTAVRESIFHILLSPEPQTMADILARAKGKIDRVSVYRNIEVFEKIGIVHRIYVGWKYKLELSDKFIAHHHHLSCLQCGKTIDIEDEKHIDEFIDDIAKKFGFHPRRHQFEVDGYCKDCAQTK